MMSDWYKTSIGEVTNWYSGGTPNKSKPEYWGMDIPWISARNMKIDRIFTSDTMISKEGLNNGSRLAPVDSLLLLVRGSELHNRIPICYVSKDVAFNQDVKCIISKEKLLPLFLFYWLKSKESFLMKMVESTSIGAGKFDTRSFQNIEITLPSLCEQKKIVEAFKCLDDKIELNNRMNKTLEEMAQAIFKSWFVDFEPFQDGEFVDSELGRIPQNYRIATVGEICLNVTDGVHNTVTDYAEGNCYLLSCKNLKNGSVVIGSNERKISKETFLRLRKRTKMSKGDILLSSVGTVGEMVLLMDPPDHYEFQRSVAMLKPDPVSVSSFYLFQALDYKKNEIVNLAHGAVQQCLFLGDINRISIMVPNIEQIREYDKIVSPWFERMNANIKENSVLSSLRDTLLPKLISGEIRVPIQEE